ncbi:MAG: PEP-CTERM sorting domain-containing protein [Phycisphaerae bacterium]|nr:PEP-CTERM sorting domain-containing protein [Phycisphaerae bacterium]MDD5380668.1 PEP-CTERM sorting domain-containing protein [Phycisphaerae bacterium]
MTAICAIFLISSVSPNTVSALTNGGFESGNFTGWTTIGVASIETAAYGAGPTKGSYQALVVSEGGSLVSDSAIETFLGLPVGTLDGFLFDDDATAGSAIKQTITVSEGDVLTFDWNFLTDEVEEGDNVRDFAFVSLSTGYADILADAVFSVFVPSSTPFNDETGFAMFSYGFTTSGTFTLGFGVMHVEDNDVDSGLLLDNVIVTPEPATVALLGLGGLSLLRRKRSV